MQYVSIDVYLIALAVGAIIFAWAWIDQNRSER